MRKQNLYMDLSDGLKCTYVFDFATPLIAKDPSLQPYLNLLDGAVVMRVMTRKTALTVGYEDQKISVEENIQGSFLQKYTCSRDVA